MVEWVLDARNNLIEVFLLPGDRQSSPELKQSGIAALHVRGTIQSIARSERVLFSLQPLGNRSSQSGDSVSNGAR